MPTCKRCGKQFSIWKGHIGVRICPECLHGEAVQKIAEAQSAPRGEALECMIPATGGVSSAEAIAKIPMMGMWEPMMRHATAKFQDGKVEIVCPDMYGKYVTVADAAFDRIRRTTYSLMSLGKQLRLAVARAALLGLAAAVVLFLLIGSKVGWNEIFDDLKPFLVLVAFSLAAGEVLAFLFSFLPAASKVRKQMALFTFWTSNTSGVQMAVEREHLRDTIELLRRVGFEPAEETAE